MRIRRIREQSQERDIHGIEVWGKQKLLKVQVNVDLVPFSIKAQDAMAGPLFLDPAALTSDNCSLWKKVSLRVLQ